MRNYRNSPQVLSFNHFNIDELRGRAAGRWLEILEAAGVPSSLLEGRIGRPCPRCGGNDRFAPMKDIEYRGAVLCRRCFNSSTDPKAGDGVATLRWWLGLSFPEVCQWLGNYLGGGVASPRVRERVYKIPIPSRKDSKRFELMAEVWARNMRPRWIEKAAQLLGLPTDPLIRLCVGWSPEHRASSWPMRDDAGSITGIRLRCPRTAQKWAVLGSVAGLFYSPELRSIEHCRRLWVVEGPTDTAALLSIGLDAIGVPSAGGGADFLLGMCRWLLPQEIVIVADRDDAGRRGAEKLADTVVIVAPVRIVSPQIGKDARAWVCSGAGCDVIESAADTARAHAVVMEELKYE